MPTEDVLYLGITLPQDYFFRSLCCSLLEYFFFFFFAFLSNCYTIPSFSDMKSVRLVLQFSLTTKDMKALFPLFDPFSYTRLAFVYFLLVYFYSIGICFVD